MPALFADDFRADLGPLAVRTPRTQLSAAPVKPDPDQRGNSWDWSRALWIAAWWATLCGLMLAASVLP